MSELIKTNKYQTPITEELLSKYPDEVVEQFMEFIETVPLIKSLISPSRPKIEDLPRALRSQGEEKVITIPIGITMDEAEKIIIQENLAANKGNKSRTADILGIGRKTLHRKLEELQIE